MSGILAPDSRPALAKNYHRENLMMMRNKELENQKKKLEDDVNANQNKEWKMRRF